MKILVCIKQVPGTNKVEVDSVTGVLKRNGVDSKMNPYDLYALEAALRLKQEHEGSTVDVISMGPPQAKAVIYEAFSMGADNGALISDRKFGGADVLATSYTLSQGIKAMGKYDLILCGLQTTDGDTAQVGPEVSELLGIPGLCCVKEIVSADEEAIRVNLELPDAIEKVKVSFPCLITVQKDINEPRLPSYLKKKATQDKEIKVYSFADMDDQDESHYGLSGSPTQVRRIFPPVSDKVQEDWQGTGTELAQRLYAQLQKQKFI